MNQKYHIQQCRQLADELGYKIVLRRVKAMRSCDIGLMCPDLHTIYVDPVSEDVVLTMAHELGHVIALGLGLPDEPETYSEDIADLIGTSIYMAIQRQNFI